MQEEEVGEQPNETANQDLDEQVHHEFEDEFIRVDEEEEKVEEN